MLSVVLSVVLSQAPEAPLLTLAEAQKIALQKNLDIQIGRERLEQSLVLTKRAWALVLPTVTANGTVTRNNIEIAFATGLPPDLAGLLTGAGITPPPSRDIVIQKLWQKNALASFRWPLINGRSIPLIQNAYDTVDVAALTFKQLTQAITYATALAYYNLLSTERQVDVRKSALENSRAHLKLEEARLAVGEATPLTKLRADVDVATQEQSLIQAVNAAAITRRALAVLIDWQDEAGVVRPFTVARPAEETPIPSGDLVQTAYAQRTDLMTKHIQLTIAERSKTETYMKFLPALIGSGSYNWSDVEGFSSQHTAWQLNLSLEWTVFEGGTTVWELEERQHAINEAVLAIDRTRQDIAREVAEARINVQSAEASHNASLRRLELAQQSQKLVDVQYQAGAATQLDVLDASRTLADAESSESVAQLLLDVARLALVQALVAPATGATGVGSPLAPTAANVATQNAITEGQ